MVILIVLSSIPESSSVHVHVITGLLFVSLEDAVGLVTAITGTTFSFTFSCRLVPSDKSAASILDMFPASSVAFNATF